MVSLTNGDRGSPLLAASGVHKTYRTGAETVDALKVWRAVQEF